MNTFRTLHRSILVLFAVVVLAIVTLVHFSISKIVAEQSRAQQQSLSPAVSLIVEQLLKPLHTSEALGHSTELVTLMEGDEVDEAAIFNTLNRLEREFGLSFFIASENAKRQFNSDGTTIDLIEGEVSWYFKYRDGPQDAVADIGKWEDTHFYIDLKVFDDDGRFLGFFGVGKSLRSFINVFDSYKEQYGYDFLFVDEKGDIMLSSDPSLVASYSDFTNLSELPWYASLPITVQDEQALNNKLVTIDQKDFLIAEVKLNQFGWTVFLLSPLEDRQTEISQAFIFSVVTLLVVVFSLFLLIYNLLYYFRRDMQPDLIVRHANRLPDRTNLELIYQSLLKEQRSISVILISVDDFGHIIDAHGRNAGDDVLDKVVAYLSDHLREQDVLGRWSSEEFIILLPQTGPHEAFDTAQNLRHGIATLTPLSESPQLQLTASFGVSFTATTRSMNEVTAHAEDALYQAKRDGHNLVRMQLIE
ncbi:MULTISPECIES: sensor domain-containing diguanylate cyclase [Alteromonas]|uniref:diguanylate cyclase n=3 Tax=Alteromonas stellipolaris TaxID=233316 RepID=A0AAW7YWS1_9ALTE|nr:MULTISPECIES: diguanylate cyclase [Alteromonas]AMJ92334.1 diguanylate cyclase [Alteromonas sp. Mac2]ALM92710.1 GGDEF domain protein [Alteromonas stellipolaris LMG 21856]AMJ76050.1 diguanylate cyclase [Alteromonas stellipolaris]AMJ88480.1 diguanylate cyclase [Alteromonas sp. Mac1]AMJ96172.1 diguanylate cyclase [Alteromonas stellipolaris]